MASRSSGSTTYLESEFEMFLDRYDPEIIHFGHLNHLSTAMVLQAKERGIPVIFTLHDFWLICPRGQFLMGDFSICDERDDRKCAKCLSKWVPKKEALAEICRRMRYLKKVMSGVDLFIAPSRFLMDKFIEFGVPENRIIYSDYGFDTSRFNGFKKNKSKNVRFGYIGTHIRSKGVNVLIDAFNQIDRNDVELKIYGRPIKDTVYLESMIRNNGAEFTGAYDNRDVAKVLAGLDAIVVPSIWYENSPLVIHEAFLARIPVIASNRGGMAEYVHHMENGLLFDLGDSNDLADKILMLAENRELISELGENAPPVKSIEEHAEEIVGIYDQFL
jgi:glycosyltransferase involved in cell wall biosynthesis